MEKRAKYELGAVVLLAILFAGALAPALLYARREARDEIRRNELAAFKQLLEQENNKTGVYPLEFDASPHRYVVEEEDNKGATAWYLRAEMENKAKPIAGFDLEAGRNFYFRVVRENGATYYDVCGGDLRCGAAPIE